MADHQGFNHQVWRTVIITVALAACLVAASAIALAREVPVTRLPCSIGYPSSPPTHKSIK